MIPVRIVWEQGPPAGYTAQWTSANAQALIYRAYTNNILVTTLSGITCTTTNDPKIKTCNTPLPQPLATEGLVFDITAVDPNTQRESAHSPAIKVPPPPPQPAAPVNPRLNPVPLGVTPPPTTAPPPC